jgi:hypothetical protein
MSNTITVYIEEEQLKTQKNNNYSLYLAKKVNDSFTVVWQSKGAVATVNVPAYQHHNEFDINTPSYMVNYTRDLVHSGNLAFTSGGKNLSITAGQTTVLDANGIFELAENRVGSSNLLINNERQGNPHEILLDSKGNNIWVNRECGMNIGTATITPKNEYQLWFGNMQETGSLIAEERSNIATVSLQAGGDKTITFDSTGDWINGEPAKVFRRKNKQTVEA